MDRLIMALATGLGLGYLPVAPGTWGTLLAFPLQLLLRELPSPWQTAGLLGFIGLAVLVAGSAEKILDRKDPGVVVIDEVAGMLVGLIAVPPSLAAWSTAFLLFRFFDIVKPQPVRFVDQHLNGGLGIVVDDLLAGGYCLLLLHGLRWLLPATFG